MYKRKKPKYFVHSAQSDFEELYTSQKVVRHGLKRTLFFLLTFFVLVGSVTVYGFNDTLPEFEITVDTQVFEKSIQQGLAVISEFEEKETKPQKSKTDKKTAFDRTYIVKEGDTLWDIAQQYYQSGYNWQDLAQANELSSPYLLSVGTEIKIPHVKSRMIAQVKIKTNPLPATHGNYNSSIASPSAIQSETSVQPSPPPVETQAENTFTTTTTTYEVSNVGFSSSASPSATTEPIHTPTETPDDNCHLALENSLTGSCEEEAEVIPTPTLVAQIL